MITPKEQAERLVNQFKEATDGIAAYDYSNVNKECALIAVSTVFDFMMMDDIYNKDCHMANAHWPQYWMNVKKEIELL